MQVLLILNIIFGALFLLCYLHQVIVYAPVGLICKWKKRKHKETKLHKLAILVAARNEEAVIGQLLDSLNRQDYPRDLFHIFVVADNCTDGTKRVAESYGATAYERFNTEQIGKGYALDYLLTCIDRDYGKGAFDAFVLFDADNLARHNFLTELNKTFSDGYEIVTGYRNSKNYGDSWIAAGSGMWFIRACATLNTARNAIGSSAELAGTGFMFYNKIKEENGGWPFHLLTEDTEFMVNSVLKGYTVGYAPDAEFFDEQPTTFRQSWVQRLRWAKGGIQVFKAYGLALFRGIFSKNFKSCYDFSLSITPAFLLALITVVTDLVGFVVVSFLGEAKAALLMFAAILGGLYLLLLLAFGIVTLSEWRRIRASAWKKILYTFTFPLFMFTYVPIVFCAVFSKHVTWQPIEHKRSDMEDL